MLSTEHPDQPVSFQQLPQEIRTTILEHSVYTNKKIFNFNGIREFIVNTFKEISSLATINKETSKNIHILYEELARDVIKQLGIGLTGTTLPWGGYKNAKEFLQATVKLADVYQNSPRLLEKQGFPTNNPVLPHLLYSFKHSYITSKELSKKAYEKAIENNSYLLTTAYQEGNVSALFALLTFKKNREKILLENALKILKNQGITIKNENEDFYFHFFSIHFLKAVEIFKYVKNNYPDLNMPKYGNLFINLLSCGNPIQALDVILKNNKMDDYNGPKSDFKQILILGKEMEYDEDLNHFFKFLRETLVNTKLGKKNIPTYTDGRRTIHKNKLAEQLGKVLNDTNSLKILKNNPQIVDLILKNPFLIAENFLKLILLINYPHFIVTFTIKELETLNEKRINILIDYKEIFQNWHVDAIKQIFLPELQKKGKTFSQFIHEDIKTNFENLKNLRVTSAEDADFILFLLRNSFDAKIHIDRAFELIRQLGIPFIKKCYEYNIKNYANDGSSIVNTFEDNNPRKHISMLLTILTTFYDSNEVISFLTGRDLNSPNIFNELIEKLANFTKLNEQNQIFKIRSQLLDHQEKELRLRLTVLPKSSPEYKQLDTYHDALLSKLTILEEQMKFQLLILDFLVSMSMENLSLPQHTMQTNPQIFQTMPMGNILQEYPQQLFNTEPINPLVLRSLPIEITQYLGLLFPAIQGTPQQTLATQALVSNTTSVANNDEEYIPYQMNIDSKDNKGKRKIEEISHDSHAKRIKQEPVVSSGVFLNNLFSHHTNQNITNAGPSNAGPSNAGPSNAGPSNAGPSNAGPAWQQLVNQFPMSMPRLQEQIFINPQRFFSQNHAPQRQTENINSYSEKNSSEKKDKPYSPKG